MNNYIIGNRIREARENKRMTQEGLAELAKLSSTAVSNIECGKACPKFNNIVAIATALELSMDFLISEEQTKSAQIYIHEINVLLNCMDERKLRHINKYIQLLNEMEETIV